MIQYNWCLDWQRPILSLTQLDFFLLFVSSSHLLFRTLIFFYYPTFFCVSTLVNNIYIHIEPLSVKTKDWVQLPAMTLFWSVDGCVVQLAGHSTVNIHINCAPAMSSHMVQHSIITNRCCCCCCSCYCEEPTRTAVSSENYSYLRTLMTAMSSCTGHSRCVCAHTTNQSSHCQHANAFFAPASTWNIRNQHQTKTKSTHIQNIYVLIKNILSLSFRWWNNSTISLSLRSHLQFYVFTLIHIVYTKWLTYKLLF